MLCHKLYQIQKSLRKIEYLITNKKKNAQSPGIKPGSSPCPGDALPTEPNWTIPSRHNSFCWHIQPSTKNLEVDLMEEKEDVK